MQITDGEGEQLRQIHLALSDDEAKELISALTRMTTAGKGWHAHITSETTFRREITVFREDDETAAEFARDS